MVARVYYENSEIDEVIRDYFVPYGEDVLWYTLHFIKRKYDVDVISKEDFIEILRNAKRVIEFGIPPEEAEKRLIELFKRGIRKFVIINNLLDEEDFDTLFHYDAELYKRGNEYIFRFRLTSNDYFDFHFYVKDTGKAVLLKVKEGIGDVEGFEKVGIRKPADVLVKLLSEKLKPLEIDKLKEE